MTGRPVPNPLAGLERVEAAAGRSVWLSVTCLRCAHAGGLPADRLLPRWQGRTLADASHRMRCRTCGAWGHVGVSIYGASP